MTAPQVEATLGAPTVRGVGHDGRAYLQYGEKEGTFPHPVAWIQFGDAGVERVYARRYWMLDHDGVYERSTDLNFETPEFVSAFGP